MWRAAGSCRPLNLHFFEGFCLSFVPVSVVHSSTASLSLPLLLLLLFFCWTEHSKVALFFVVVVGNYSNSSKQGYWIQPHYQVNINFCLVLPPSPRLMLHIVLTWCGIWVGSGWVFRYFLQEHRWEKCRQSFGRDWMVGKRFGGGENGAWKWWANRGFFPSTA